MRGLGSFGFGLEPYKGASSLSSGPLTSKEASAKDRRFVKKYREFYKNGTNVPRYHPASFEPRIFLELASLTYRRRLLAMRFYGLALCATVALALLAGCSANAPATGTIPSSGAAQVNAHGHLAPVWSENATLVPDALRPVVPMPLHGRPGPDSPSRAASTSASSTRLTCTATNVKIRIIVPRPAPSRV